MNPTEPINPAEQVEKIREILVGRDMKLVNGRIQQLESEIKHQNDDLTRELTERLKKADERHKASQENIQSITAHIRQQLQQEGITRGQQINDLAKKIDSAATRMDQTTQQLIDAEAGRNNDISKKIENLSSEMASRIDAHSRQIMEHMHREIQQWKTRMDTQISSLTESKVDREEMSTRLARIASAAMGETAPPMPSAPAPSSPHTTGSVPDIPAFSSLDVFAKPTDDYTS